MWNPTASENDVLDRTALFLNCLCGFLLAGGLAHATTPPMNGIWETTFVQLGVGKERRLRIDHQDSSYIATVGDRHYAGQLTDGILHLTCKSDGPACGDLRLHLENESIVGEGTIDAIPVALRGKRPAVRPYNNPQVFEFHPQQFSGVFGSDIKPVLTVFPGDTVRTSTVDAEGFDSKGIRRTTLINPQTGPFFIESAMPGDTLAIHFSKIRTNSLTADMYGDALAANALEPYTMRRDGPTPKGVGTWSLDPERGLAVPIRPSVKLSHFSIPLQPMLGCVGVAPPFGQSIRTVNLGAYGGNLDYRGVHEGSTVYLPVFQRGALLFLGDGHALQGDGELTGTGLETSMDVEFSIELIKDQSMGQPRIEDAEFIMVSGIGGSLGEALQLATSGMARWLKDTYGLNPGEIAMVLGSAMRYDIAEIVDPQIHVVAKLNKNLLSTLTTVELPTDRKQQTIQ